MNMCHLHFLVNKNFVENSKTVGKKRSDDLLSKVLQASTRDAFSDHLMHNQDGNAVDVCCHE